MYVRLWFFGFHGWLRWFERLVGECAWVVVAAAE